jgi:acyl-CoA hydrolase
MDNAAGVVAARHSSGPVVTGHVEDVNFINPVQVGDLVIIRSKITFVSKSTIEVQVEAEREDIFSEHPGGSMLAVTALFVMVAVDAKGKARDIPPLILCTEEEERLFSEGKRRHASSQRDRCVAQYENRTKPEAKT